MPRSWRSVRRADGACPPAYERLCCRTGLAAADGGVVGVITASNQGTITLWPEGVLRAAAQERGLALQSEHSPREAWPLLCYWSAGEQGQRGCEPGAGWCGGHGYAAPRTAAAATAT